MWPYVGNKHISFVKKRNVFLLFITRTEIDLPALSIGLRPGIKKSPLALSVKLRNVYRNATILTSYLKSMR